MTGEETVAAAELGTVYQVIPLEQLDPSRTNPRTHFDETRIADLARSLKEKGCIEPIVVRQADVGGRRQIRFEIVAGECRWRAAKLAGLPGLPAVVRAYTDDQVLEIQIDENDKRNDFAPLERAQAYRRLINSNPDKHSVHTIATRVGQSVDWVWNYLSLLKLVPAARALLEQARISAGHAFVLARQKPADQERLIKPPRLNGYGNHKEGLWQFEDARLLEGADEAAAKKSDPYYGLKPVTIRELETYIREHIRFDPAHAGQAQPLIFEETAAAVKAAREEPGRGKKVVPITYDYRCPDAAKDDTERTFGAEAWKRADGLGQSKTCEHAVLGFVVAGTRAYGESFKVCVARDRCRVHWGGVIRQREKTQKLLAAGKTQQATQAQRRADQRAHQREEQRWKKEEEARKRWDAAVPAMRQALIAKVKAVKPTHGAVVSRLLRHLRFGKEIQAAIGKPKRAEDLIRALLLNELFTDLRNGAWNPQAATKAARAFGVNVKTILERENKKAAAKATDSKPAAAKKGRAA